MGRPSSFCSAILHLTCNHQKVNITITLAPLYIREVSHHLVGVIIKRVMERNVFILGRIPLINIDSISDP